MDITTTQEILFFRLMICAIVMFWAQHMLSYCSLIFFVCQTYAVIILKLCLFETGKSIFQEIVQLVVVLFAAEFTLFVVVYLSFLWWSCLESPLCTTIFIIVKNVFKRNLTCLTQFSFPPFPILFYRVTLIFIESESICFGSSTLTRLTFVDKRKDVLRYNLHGIGRICKEG